MTKTAKTNQTTSLHPCACSTFAFGTYGEDGSAESYEDYTTGCGRMTNRVFAQGHDAKLVGFMVRADMAGEEISSTVGGMRMTYQNAVHAAGTISEALAAKAQAQLDAAAARVAKKASKPKVTKTPKKAMEDLVERQAKAVVETVPATTELAEIKVGRWTYLATIEADGNATYKNKLGARKTALIGTYKLV